jgi:hypothetical protein
LCELLQHLVTMRSCFSNEKHGSEQDSLCIHPVQLMGLSFFPDSEIFRKATVWLAFFFLAFRSRVFGVLSAPRPRGTSSAGCAPWGFTRLFHDFWKLHGVI